jgi:hypothetical protein
MNLSLVIFWYFPELTCLTSYWFFSTTKMCAKIYLNTRTNKICAKIYLNTLTTKMHSKIYLPWHTCDYILRKNVMVSALSVSMSKIWWCEAPLCARMMSYMKFPLPSLWIIYWSKALMKNSKAYYLFN